MISEEGSGIELARVRVRQMAELNEVKRRKQRSTGKSKTRCVMVRKVKVEK